MLLLSLLSSIIRNTPLWILYVQYLLFRFAHFLLEVPTVRMIENAICHQQLDHVQLSAVSMLTELDEMICKTAPVQEQVARVVGWKMSFDAVPGLVSAVYFGSIADKGHFRMVLTMCCIGYLLALLWVLMTCYFYTIFPISVTLLSSLFLLIGGGPLVFAAVTAALVADLVETSSRTRYLFLLAAMPHFDKLISPPLATALMARNLYLPSIVSSIIVVFCIVLLRLVRNPAQAYKATPTDNPQFCEPLLNNNDQSHETASADYQSLIDDAIHERNDTPTETTGSIHQADVLANEALVPRTLHQLKRIATWLRRQPVLSFCYLAFFLKSNAMASEAFTFQYLSEKFGWPLQDTTVLRFALSFGAVLTTLVFGPLASSALVSRGVPTPMVDLGIIHISLFVLTICFIVAWQANSSTVFILSMLGAGFCEGLEPALQGLLSAVARTEEMGRLFAFIYMCSLLGDMTGGPIMAALMSIRKSPNTVSEGYCFLASSIIFAIMGVSAYNVRVSR